VETPDGARGVIPLGNLLGLLGVSNPLRPLEDFLQSALIWLHETVGFSWAWSIIVLTVMVRILLVPVTVKQIHSMQNLQAHAPEMKAIQQKWKHDKQRQNEELMKFYKENKINPAASCLPIVLQIPIFISLFYVLREFDSDVLPSYGGSVDWVGLVNITEPVKDGWGPLLLVIYVLSQLSSSYFMSTTMQGAQRVLLMVLPVLFVPFILNFPAGLMLYWLTTNLWTTGQGLVTRRLMPKPEPPEKRSSRTPAKEEPAETNGRAAAEGAAKQPTAPTRKPVAGPPRRVKRKRGGGSTKR
jgi:YidC/Oxa1 family membrane protein insertase